jgi:hypothetical protein
VPPAAALAAEPGGAPPEAAAAAAAAANKAAWLPCGVGKPAGPLAPVGPARPAMTVKKVRIFKYRQCFVREPIRSCHSFAMPPKYSRPLTGMVWKIQSSLFLSIEASAAPHTINAQAAALIFPSQLRLLQSE